MDVVVPSVPAWVLFALGGLAVVEIVLDVVALVDLYRRPTEQVVAGNKWIWLIVIVMVNIIGAIIYLVAGRRPPSVDQGGAGLPPSTWSIEGVVDALYGPQAEGNS